MKLIKYEEQQSDQPEHWHVSRAGYKFHRNEQKWQLDKDMTVYFGHGLELLEVDARVGCLNTLVYFAENHSPTYTLISFDKLLFGAGLY